MYLSDIDTLPASLAGVPAMSIPVGLSANGLHIGMQIITPHLQEYRAVAIAAACERHDALQVGAPARFP
jgi:aspartyl-tRNA(Asn)/glutamyl-tRNA(Gln) amidotransferase subunit A